MTQVARDGLRGLIKRIAKLTEADREVDCLIVIALDLRPSWMAGDGGHLWLDKKAWRPTVRLNRLGGRNSAGNTPINDDDIPRFTASVDDALGLVAQVLPQRAKLILEWRGGDLVAADTCTASFYDEPEQFGATLPLAILLALLSALESASDQSPTPAGGE